MSVSSLRMALLMLTRAASSCSHTSWPLQGGGLVEKVSMHVGETGHINIINKTSSGFLSFESLYVSNVDL